MVDNNNSATIYSDPLDPRLISFLSCCKKGDIEAGGALAQQLPRQILEQQAIKLADSEMEAAVKEAAVREIDRRNFEERPAARSAPDGRPWVLTPDLYAIVSCLDRERQWVSAAQIARAVGGEGKTGRPRAPQWASMRCRKLIAQGLIEENEKGEFRTLRNVLDVVQMIRRNRL